FLDAENQPPACYPRSSIQILFLHRIVPLSCYGCSRSYPFHKRSDKVVHTMAGANASENIASPCTLQLQPASGIKFSSLFFITTTQKPSYGAQRQATARNAFRFID